MLCRWCEQETPDDSVFCANCGHAVERDAAHGSCVPEPDAAKGPGQASFDESAKASVEAPVEKPAEESAYASAGKSAEALVDESADASTAKSVEASGEDGEPLFDQQSQLTFEDVVLDAPLLLDVPALPRTDMEEAFIDPPSGPLQPQLDRKYIAIVAAIATLFAAAVILLACSILMRVLGI